MVFEDTVWLSSLMKLEGKLSSHYRAFLRQAEPKAVFLLVHVDVQARPQLVSGIQTQVFGKRNSNKVRRRDEVPVAEQVHAEKIALHKKTRRVRQVKAELRSGHRN